MSPRRGLVKFIDKMQQDPYGVTVKKGLLSKFCFFMKKPWQLKYESS